MFYSNKCGTRDYFFTLTVPLRHNYILLHSNMKLQYDTHNNQHYCEFVFNFHFGKKNKRIVFHCTSPNMQVGIKVKKNEIITSQEIGVYFPADRNDYLITRDVRLCIGK